MQLLIGGDFYSKKYGTLNGRFCPCKCKIKYVGGWINKTGISKVSKAQKAQI